MTTNVINRLFGAAANCGEDSGDMDQTINGLQGMLGMAWILMTPEQQQLLIQSEAVAAVIKSGARAEFEAPDLLKELATTPVPVDGIKKMAVLCTNSQGELELFTCAPVVTADQVENGEHYEMATDIAEQEGYEGLMIAFDDRDRAARQLVQTAIWFNT